MLKGVGIISMAVG